MARRTVAGAAGVADMHGVSGGSGPFVRSSSVPRSWTSSPELHLDVDVRMPRGRRLALERALRAAIHDGRLTPGAVLPSSRALAADLHLSRGTVVDAYAQLVAEGYLVSQPGSVTAVAENAVRLPGPAASPGSAGTAGSAVLPARAPAPRSMAPARIDLRPGLLDLGSTFPRSEWLRAERTVLRTSPDDAFDYGDPRGTIALREA